MRCSSFLSIEDISPCHNFRWKLIFFFYWFLISFCVYFYHSGCFSSSTFILWLYSPLASIYSDVVWPFKKKGRKIKIKDLIWSRWVYILWVSGFTSSLLFSSPTWKSPLQFLSFLSLSVADEMGGEEMMETAPNIVFPLFRTASVLILDGGAAAAATTLAYSEYQP